MSIKIIKQDITTVETGIIVHQVNCQGVMGSGVAKSIKDRWNVVEKEYKQFIKNSYDSLLGHSNIVKVKSYLYVVNFFGQDFYGVEKRHTDYDAWKIGMPRLKKLINNDNLVDLKVYFPYNVGCDRGGGDFSIISAIINENFPDAIFCKLWVFFNMKNRNY